jgi:hypothetical protein
MASVTIWNRLEPRCRSEDLSDGLAARVHDPLWLLARQWQVAEFAGRDVGSPVTAQVQWTTAQFDRFSSGTAPAVPYDGSQPVETLVERETVRPPKGTGDLMQAAEAGLYFLRLLDSANLAHLRSTYLQQYPLAAQAGSDADSQKVGTLVAGRAVDGIQLRADLAHAAGALPALPALSPADGTAVLPVAKAWLTWFDSLFSEPASANSWSPDRMEYQFSLGAAGDANAIVAQEYDGAGVDWYTFDRSSSPLAGGSAQPVTTARSITVSPVTFNGMPARRFWEMEDAAVDIGALTAGAEDLGRLLLREFALIYGNDWFQVPLAVPVGCQVSIGSLLVADTFGITTTTPHYAAADGPTGLWRMFSPATDAIPDAPEAANLLLVTPSGVGTLESTALEDVLLLRDEPAEMGWGVERTAVGPSGNRVDRGLVWRTAQPPVEPPSNAAIPKYRLGSTVPDYWIPLIPVAVNDGPLQLHRGRLPTAASGPIGQFLADPGLTIYLEELPQEGVHLERLYRCARGVDGSTHLWIGRCRSTGRGEGRSGLRFDFLEF